MKTGTLIKPYLQLGSVLLLLFQCLPANAADLTASSADPFLLFKTTAPAVNNEWLIRGNQNEFRLFNYNMSKDLFNFTSTAEMQLKMDANSFQIEDGSANDIVRISRDAPLSLDIQSNGDVSLAGINFKNNGVTSANWQVNGSEDSFSLINFDTLKVPLSISHDASQEIDIWNEGLILYNRESDETIRISSYAPSSLDIDHWGNVELADGVLSVIQGTVQGPLAQVGIGTTAPQEDLEIQSPEPGIYFDDTSTTSADWYLGHNANNFIIQTRSNDTGGPSHARVLGLYADTGFVGMNMDGPTAALHVGSPDTESAKVLVENTTATVAPRTLFELKNPGNTKFTVNNTDAAVQWAFANPGTGFRLSRQGSGFVEFEVFNNGDARLEGVLVENSDVNSKQGIEAIDTAEILEKVVAMPISQWRYKDAPDTKHLGPMAQDFHAAFGLGNTDKGISTLDSSGVALAAIQGLETQVVELRNQLVGKNRQIESLERRIADMESNLELVVSVLLSGSKPEPRLVTQLGIMVSE